MEGGRRGRCREREIDEQNVYCETSDRMIG